MCVFTCVVETKFNTSVADANTPFRSNCKMIRKVLFVQLLILFLLWDSFKSSNCIDIGNSIADGYTYLKGNTICRYYECCDNSNIPGNISALKHELSSKVFGQHIVQQHLIPALEMHLSAESKSRKPLVISFHGPTGTGKNFVANHIAKALYRNGLQSKYVHVYKGRVDFTEDTKVNEYKARLKREIPQSLQECSRSLFIFDEMDKVPSGLFESIASYADYDAFKDSTDNSKAIFIFISNIGSKQISEKIVQLMRSGQQREETKLKDFENILQNVAYVNEGGFHKSSLVEDYVIDFYMPFLPLEKTHVIKCLEMEFLHWGHIPRSNEINEIFDEAISFGNNGIFAQSGCKTLEKKVASKVKTLQARRK